ncbi:hypothetical protein [Segatella copri]|uniref:Uncharacterized protein n=1 Tax=Segatella copri TaxID=165179 RepID=A0AA90UXM4_9BACT|nr:hypothetical protein [Segatella copri]MQN82715.1 hypothetical protein [Segatella copri]
MAETLNPAIGYIGNAIRSVAKDHITSFAEDTYDEHFQEYQAILNKLNAIQDEEGNLEKTPFKYIVNEEFIFAMVDVNDVLLAGIEWDGTPKFAKMEENAGREISSINAQIKYLHEEISQVRTDLKRNVFSLSFDRDTGRIIGTTSDTSRITSCTQDRTTGKIIMNHQLD